MTDAADREAGFLAVLEAAEEYLQCQHELSCVLRAGFFGLARARYQMGPSKVRYASLTRPPPPPQPLTQELLVMPTRRRLRRDAQVGPSQYPATMRATRRVHGSETDVERQQETAVRTACISLHNVSSSLES